MKKLTAVLLIAAVFLSVLSGCGGGARRGGEPRSRGH